jgi:hypothetical protein
MDGSPLEHQYCETKYLEMHSEILTLNRHTQERLVQMQGEKKLLTLY